MQTRHFVQLIAMSALWGASFPLLRIASPAFGPMALAGIRCALAALVLALLMRMLGERWPARAAWLPLAALGLLTSGFMYWISMRLMREIPASTATSAAFMIPLFGVTWGSLFLGEPVTAGMLPGSLLILLAAALITGFNPWRMRRRLR